MDWTVFEHAKILRESGKAEEALAELQDLVKSASGPEESAVVRMGIANCLRHLGRSEEARKPLVDAYSVLERRSQIYPRVMFVEALVEEDQGNWFKELQRLDQILASHEAVLETPDNSDLKAEVLRHRGIALLGLGRYAEARPLLEAALLEEYDRDLTLNYLGQCYLELGLLEQAKKCFKEALTLGLPAGYELDLRYRLGVLHYRLSEYAWALQEFEWCFEHRQGGKVSEELILQGLTGTLITLGKVEEAQRYASIAKRDYPGPRTTNN